MDEKPRIFIAEIKDKDCLPESDKYGHKKMLHKLIEEYPEILDPSKLEPTEDGKGFYILRDESIDSDNLRKSENG